MKQHMKEKYFLNDVYGTFLFIDKLLQLVCFHPVQVIRFTDYQCKDKKHGLGGGGGVFHG